MLLLQVLHLDQTFVTADSLAGVLEGCQELKSLSVGARSSSSWPAPAGPPQGLCLPSQAPINNTLLTSVAAHCKNLEELRISGELPTNPSCHLCDRNSRPVRILSNRTVGISCIRTERGHPWCLVCLFSWYRHAVAGWADCSI